MRILWLKTELLHPVDKGGRIRTYAMLRELRKRHHVAYLTLDDGSADENAAARAAEYCDELVTVPFRAVPKFSAGFYAALVRNLASPLPYFLAKYRSAAMRRAIAQRLREQPPDVVVCDFLNPAVNLPPRLECASVLFQHNVEAMIWRRHFEVERNPLERMYLHDQWRKARRAEARICRRFDAVVAVSPEDTETLRTEYALGNVEDVPTGVDADYFRPSPSAAPQDDTLVFTGSMDWLPNLDAMRFFLRDVLPLLHRKAPNIRFDIVGRNPGAELIELAGRLPGVHVAGRVPDVRPFIERAAVFVVPIRVGSGTRLKVFEAMAMERPIVSTTVGCEGLPVRHGEHLLIADDAADFADAVHRLLSEPVLASRLAANAAALVRSRFDWSSVAARFEAICESAVASRPHSSPTRGDAIASHARRAQRPAGAGRARSPSDPR